MLNVTVDEIQSDPLKYIRQVEAGETLVIVENDQAIAELKPITSNKLLPYTQAAQQMMDITSSKQLRPYALCAGEFTVPDDFDAPLPEDLLNVFEGK
ncbi:MAG: type II toxin-antitoxin system Phd/YefM family antitoxin [Chroococcus sp. CMT-3BRIN-NPC107]|jgi:antitoxin (DNA-binding transcriptional repressor) of toxin-antitoxin stability system|nr:type II toxin-antitoxin system Phd/YefM family antitoxin [Chroococcus sp. CMT-3BRIN-NPC107]